MPCLVHLPELLGWLSCNPIRISSGLSSGGLHGLPNPGWLGGLCYVDGNAGLTVQALGGASATQWLHGSLPWWNHFAGAGLPLASEMQSGAMFLPFVLLLHFANGMLYLKLSLQILAGIFTLLSLRQLNLRQLGLHPLAATCGAILFELNGTFLWFSDAPIQPIAFLPMLVLGIERCRRTAAAGRSGGQSWVALGMAFSLLAGFPETAYMDGVLALLWAASAVWRTEPSRRWPCAVKIGTGGICGLLLSAPAVVPFLQDLPLSSMALRDGVRTSRLAAGQAAQILFPALFGPPYSGPGISFRFWLLPWGALGPSLALLSIAAVVSDRRHAFRWMLAGWIVFCLAAAFRLPVAGTIREIIPGFGQIEFCRYAGPSAEFAAAVLAALALDDWQRGKRLRMTMTAAIWTTMAVISLALVRDRLLAVLAEGPPASLLAAASVVLGLGCVVALAALLGQPATRARRLAAGGVITLEAVLLSLPPVLAGVPGGTLRLAPVAFLQAHAGLSRVYAMGGVLLPNYGSYFGIPMVNDAAMPRPRLWVGYASHLAPDEAGRFLLGTAGSPASRAASLVECRSAFAETAVKYVLTPAAGDPLAVDRPADILDVFDDGDTHIYQLQDAKPYFETGGASCRLVPIDQDHLRAHCDGPGTLMRREMNAPGWRVRVNGQDAAIRGSGEMFQQIGLPTGDSTITWHYAPPHVTAILGLFGLGVAMLLGFWRHAAVRPERLSREPR